MADEELRAEIIDALLKHYESIFGEGRGWNLTEGFADAVLALRAVQEALAAAEVRVAARELLIEVDQNVRMTRSLRVRVDRLRRALAGEYR